jgi:Gram-negative bacterial TonB protein C-terminal
MTSGAAAATQRKATAIVNVARVIALIHSSFVIALTLLCCAPWGVKSQVPVTGGVAVYAPAPEYPITARRHHWTDAGIFVCKLRPHRTVSSVDVRKTTGHEILDQAAIAAVRSQKVSDFASKIFYPDINHL